MTLSASDAKTRALKHACAMLPEVDPASWQVVDAVEHTDPRKAAEEIALHGRLISGPQRHWCVVLNGADDTTVTIELDSVDGILKQVISP